MADYNYTYLDTTFDLSDKKQNDFFYQHKSKKTPTSLGGR